VRDNTWRIVVVVLLMVLCVTPAHAWYSGWNYRKAITIDKTQVNGTLTNFPLLVRIDGDTSFAAYAQSDADDFVFTNSSDGKLDHEVELYNSTTGQLVAWVRIPSLTNASNTTLYLYFGNSTATSQQNKTGVWDTSYRGVWHLGDTSTNIIDSRLTNNATKAGTSNPAAVAGLCGVAQNYSSTSDYINLSGSTDFNLATSTSEVTLSAWIKTIAGDASIFGLRDSAGLPVLDLQLGTDGVDNNNNGIPSFIVRDDAGNGLTHIHASSSVNNNSWRYIVASRNSSKGLTIIVDGGVVATGTDTMGTSVTTTSGYRRIGDEALNGGIANMNGLIDEARFSATARSSQWVQTEYNNQKSSSNMLTFGSVEGSGSWYNSSWLYRKNLTIDASQVNGTHTDFPLLVRIANDSQLASNAQTSGNDLLFTTSGSSKIEHEIELYNSTTGQLVAWVRLPSLSNASNTTIMLYYGNSGTSNQQNRTGVWDTNYKGVWHLAEAPDATASTLEINDSTSNANQGNASGSMGSSNLINGSIGRGITFDGNNDYLRIPDAANLRISGNITYSAWIYNKHAHGFIMGKTATDWTYAMEAAQDSQQFCENIKTGGVYSPFRIPSSSYAGGLDPWNDRWVYLVATFNGTHGVLVLNATNLTVTDLTDGSITTTTDDFNIGNRGGLGSATFFNSTIDEVRVSAAARPFSWIQTEYNNQKPGSTMVTAGPQEATDNSCSPTSNQPWTLSLASACTISGVDVSVTTWTITGSGTATITNSNISYTNKTWVPGSGLGRIILLGNNRIIRR
jgi:hypothetical protein